MQSKYVIGITGGKGGVGKSNVAVNLGVSLAKIGCRPLIIDADINMGNVELLLGIKSKYNIKDLLDSACNIEEVLIRNVHGIDILPTGVANSLPREINGDDIVSMVNYIEQSTIEHDVIIIDTSAGIGSSVMNVLSLCSDILVVGCNEPTSIMDAYSLIKIMSMKLGRREFLFLANMVISEEAGKQAYRSLTRVSDSFLNVDIRYWGHVPTDKDVAKAVCKQQPYIVTYPSSRASRNIEILSSKFASRMKTKGFSSLIRETI